jgi:1-phosphatidylinositol phosphodiesterase
VIAKKGGDVRGLLTCADHDPEDEHWYLNFTSAFEINVVYQLNPRQIAVGGWWFFRWKHGLNIRLRQYLKELPIQRRRFGVVAMDFPEQGADDLISAVFMSNFGDDTAGIWRSWVILLATIVALLSLLTFFSGTLRGNG